MHWLAQSQRRQRLLLALHQPLTANQLADRADLGRDICSRVLNEFQVYRLADCLNQDTRRSRLYWLTPLGLQTQRQLYLERDLQPISHTFPVVDWALYGQVCFSHRSAVLKALTGQLQAVAIRRRACSHNPQLRMSANNCRDVLYFFLKAGVVRQVRLPREQHPRYELTETGAKLQLLLQRAEVHVV